MGWWSDMSDEQVGDWLRSVPREISEQDVFRIEREKDQRRGVFIQPDHHEFGESRH